MRDIWSEILDKICRAGLNFDRLDSYIVIEGTLINETPLKIGKGAGGLGEVDIPVIRDERGIPYIPGSTLKGSLRSLAEKIAVYTLGRGEVCDVFTRPHECGLKADVINKIYWCIVSSLNEEAIYRCLERRVGSDDALRVLLRRYHFEDGEIPEYLKLLKEGIREKRPELISELTENRLRPCVICRIFGNQALSSHLIIYDSYPKDSSSIKLGSRTRVALDRFRSAALSGALFTYQYVPPGYEWNFRIDIRNIDITRDGSEEAKVIKSILDYMVKLGINLGGMRSVGHGLVILNPEKTVIRKYVVKDLEITLDYEAKLSNLLRVVT